LKTCFSKFPKSRRNGNFKESTVLGFLFVCFCVSSAQAIYDPELILKKGKRWSVAVAATTGYDDNINTSALTPQGSLFSVLGVDGVYAYPSDNTYLSVRGGTHATWYFQRQGNGMDQDDAVDINFTHTFSPRLNFDMHDHLRFGQQPEISSDNVIVRRQGDYVNNGVDLGLSYQLQRQWYVDFSLYHDIWSYADLQIASVLSRQAYGGGPSVRYRMSDRTTFSANYRLTEVAYELSPRSALDHVVTAGFSHDLRPRWNVNAEGGLEIRQPDLATSSSTASSSSTTASGAASSDMLVAPFFTLSSSYKITEQTILTGGLRYSFQDTDLSTYYVSRSTSGYGIFDWRIYKNLTSVSSLDLIHTELTDPIVAGTPETQEDTFVIAEKVTWRLAENLDLSLKYSYTELASSVALRGYNRTIFSFGATYLF